MSATSVLYDLTHFHDVVVMYQAESGRLTDPADADRFLLSLYAGAAVLGALIVAVAGLCAGTWLGRDNARISLAIVADPFVLGALCWSGDTVGGFHLLGADHDETFPLWAGLLTSVGMSAVLLGSVSTSLLPVARSVMRYCRARGVARDSTPVPGMVQRPER
jgi:hypothetical protein